MVEVTPHLTATEWDEKARQTYDGQAAWAGGSPGRQCFQCKHFAFNRSLANPPTRGLRAGCLKYHQMTVSSAAIYAMVHGKPGPNGKVRKRRVLHAFPGSALACRYFEARGRTEETESNG